MDHCSFLTWFAKLVKLDSQLVTQLKSILLFVYAECRSNFHMLVQTTDLKEFCQISLR